MNRRLPVQPSKKSYTRGPYQKHVIKNRFQTRTRKVDHVQVLKLYQSGRYKIKEIAKMCRATPSRVYQILAAGRSAA